ncbi:OmpA family protein [Desulfobotulus sp. H1]|uniref:OmpA family protein n=1 Tax=Desulfobotulus pelophilus TaxID=2823377 RepID=A0ABT3N7Y7_9BACT|nr:OmpA family protein [Desulfobotulus pelophilus]MCW7753568.1 OmpA family protein [Desulfobotulus pelophilus]
MREKRGSDDFLQEDDGPGWIVTYADLVTLLLVFFVLLYSISSLNMERFKQAFESIRISLGQDLTTLGIIEVMEVPELDRRELTVEEIFGQRSREEAIVEDINAFIAERNVGDHITVQILNNKIVVRIRGTILFESGSEQLTGQAAPILEQIVHIFRAYPEYNINIRGHTDDVPIATLRFPSNWELSAFRATTVLKYLIDKGISPFRLTATGYGSLLPLRPNTTDENRAINRRVEFVLEKKG